MKSSTSLSIVWHPRQISLDGLHCYHKLLFVFDPVGDLLVLFGCEIEAAVTQITARRLDFGLFDNR